jgi:hypothetical protein
MIYGRSKQFGDVIFLIIKLHINIVHLVNCNKIVYQVMRGVNNNNIKNES